MSPSPISPNSVHIVLQYIHPPSQLDQPLPSYLLSKSLLQRHHFLAIQPEEPAEYLCWPADTSSKAIEVLEALPSCIQDDAPQTYPVHYTSDDEHTYAHVQLSPVGSDTVRLVFQWDELDGWKYHDAKLMPFPAGSSASLQDALASHASAPTAAATAVSPKEYNPYGFNHGEDRVDESDDDDYWNSYGADESDDPSGARFSAGKDTAGDSEDAYWARYSAVHGTADSTIPSPPIQRRRLHPYADDHIDADSPLPVPVRTNLVDTPGDVLPILPSLANQMNTVSRWDPASPKALARLLADISPRHSPVQEPASLSDLEDEPGLSPGLESSGTSETASSDALGLITDSISPSLYAAQSDIKAVSDLDILDADDEALRQSVKGLYALWRSGRSRKDFPDDAEAFMSVVRDAIP